MSRIVERAEVVPSEYIGKNVISPEPRSEQQ